MPDSISNYFDTKLNPTFLTGDIDIARPTNIVQEIDVESIEADEDLDEGIEVDLINRKLASRNWEPSIREIATLESEKELVFNPKWQREYVWDRKKLSRLVESVLLNIPIPVIYLNEDLEGNYTIIDGQQRLTALVSFYRGEKKLIGLAVMKELNGKAFKDLETPFRKKFQSQPISCIVLESSSHPDIKFEVFERLNTGSVKLNEDELRNVTFRGGYLDMVTEFTKNTTFQKLVKNTAYVQRMKDRGIIIRFLSFYNCGYANYKPSIKQFVNRELESLQNLNEAKKKEFEKQFKQAVELSYSTFGENSFRRFISGRATQTEGKWVREMNMALYDIILWGFTRYSKERYVPHLDEIYETLMKLMSDDQEFIDSIQISTSSSASVYHRFAKWQGKLDLILGQKTTNPRLFKRSEKIKIYESIKNCALCNQYISCVDDADLDHIIPYSKGGLTELNNCQITHRYCNRLKSNIPVNGQS